MMLITISIIYSKEFHMECWRSFEYCLAYDADPEIYGMGTHNLPVMSSDGKKVAYNIWMFDSRRRTMRGM